MAIDPKKLGPVLIQELQRRSTQKNADRNTLLEQLGEGTGAHLFVGEKNGEVSLLVPVEDGFDGPSKVKVAVAGAEASVLQEAKKSGTVEIEGVKFNRFVLEPLKYADKLDGERPSIALQGEGPDGTWSPLGFDDWFMADYATVRWLALSDQFVLAPEVRPDPKDPSWKKLDDTQRKALEKVLDRPLPNVVHQSLLDEALSKGKDDDGLINGALQGLSLALDKEIGEEKEVAIDDRTRELIDKARPGFSRALGKDALDPEGFPKELLEVAYQVLSDMGASEASTIRTLLGGGEVDREELVQAALDAAFGAGFMENRAPSLALVDAVLDLKGDKLTLDDVTALRQLRAQLDYQSEVELFGNDGVEKPMDTDSADEALRKLYQQLKKGTGLSDAPVLQLAARLQAALHLPSPKPQVIVLSGAKGTAVDTLFKRAKEVAGEGTKPFEVQGATDLRIADPVGYLIGSPNGESNLVKGALVPTRKDGRFVATLDGLEALGSGVVGEKREVAQRSFWSFIQQVQRDGWFRGYAGGDDGASTKVEVPGGVILLRTTQSLEELRKTMPEAVWAQLQPQVIDFGKTDAPSVLAELGAAIEDHLMELYGFKDAKVTIGAAAQTFIEGLVESGMDTAQLQQMVLREVLPRIFYAAHDETLAPQLKIELVRGLTPKEKAKMRDEWLSGRHVSFAGGGGAIFTLHDEGKFTTTGRAQLSAKLQRKMARDREIEQLRQTILSYQGQAKVDDKRIQELIAENFGARARIGELDENVALAQFRNAQQKAEIEDLRRLNRLANETIDTLQSDLKEANARIDQLNIDLKKAKDAGESLKAKLQTAIAERDQIQNTLRAVESEFDRAIRGFADSFAAVDPRIVFAMVEKAAAGGANRYAKGLVDQLFNVATSAALQRANQLQGVMGKWSEIAVMAQQYVSAARALGRAPDSRVLQMMETAGRLSGNNGAPADRFTMTGWDDVPGSMRPAYDNVRVSQWENQLAKEWERVTGVGSNYQGEDPGVMTNAFRNMARYFGVRLGGD